MRNKIVAIVLCITLTASMLFTACGNTETSTEEPKREEQKVEEQKQEEPKVEESEPEKTEEAKVEESEPEKTEEPTPEPDKPLDIEANSELMYLLEVLAGSETGFMQPFDYNLTLLNNLFALNDNAISAFMYNLGGINEDPEGGRTEADSVLYSVEQMEHIISSLVGYETDLSRLANDNGWIEIEFRTDVLYIECKNWNTEYIGNNTWKIYVDIYSINEYFSYKAAEMIYTVIENPVSIFDGYSVTGVEVTNPNISEWASAYFDYLSTDRSEYDYDNLGKYYLIYLDDDDIPEIYFQGPDVPTGDSLIFYSQGEVKEEWLGWYSQGEYIEPKYISGSGVLHSNFGSQGSYGDDVIQLIDGELQYLGRGYFEVKEEYGMSWDYYGELLTLWWNGDSNAVAERSEEFNTVFEFWWNDQTVTFEEYYERLNSSFDAVNAESCIYSSLGNLDYVLSFLSSLANQ